MAKMIQGYSLLYIIVLLKLVLSWELHDNPNEPRAPKRTVTDPVSSIISGLGDLILDVDKAIAETTEPRVNHESSFVSQILGPMQPRREYFDRIQQNYRSVQNRIGSLISDVVSANRNNVRKDPVKIPSMNRQDAILGRSSVDIRSTSSDMHKHFKEDPFVVPVTDSSTHRHDEITERSLVNRVSPRQQYSEARQSPTVLEPEEQIKRALEKVIADTQKTRDLLLGSGKLTGESLFARRNGDAKQPDTEGDNQGRIIGDILYSESRFDQYIRQLIKDHGKWVLDNPLLQRWRGSRKVSDSNLADEVSSPSTEIAQSTSTEYSSTEGISTKVYEPEPTTKSEKESLTEQEPFEKRSELEPLPLMASNYYRIADDGSIVNEEIDIVLAPESVVEDDAVLATESDQETIEEEDEMIEDYYEDEKEPRDTVLLAFTADGIPLKLRMGPEIINPVSYLHTVLKSAGVTLKVPVESYEDLEPVGKEVLLLGSEYGAITRAVYLDLSNTNELKSLLRTLMKSKVNEMS